MAILDSVKKGINGTAPQAGDQAREDFPGPQGTRGEIAPR
jgi:hypothetical protein